MSRPESEPVWPAPSDYADPKLTPISAGDDDVQKVFDTVTGPNLRKSDNLIQLAMILVGAFVGALGGFIYNRMKGNDLVLGPVVGGFFGLLLMLFVSGAIIGLVRGIKAAKH